MGARDIESDRRRYAARELINNPRMSSVAVVALLLEEVLEEGDDSCPAIVRALKASLQRSGYMMKEPQVTGSRGELAFVVKGVENSPMPLDKALELAKKRGSLVLPVVDEEGNPLRCSSERQPAMTKKEY